MILRYRLDDPVAIIVIINCKIPRVVSQVFNSGARNLTSCAIELFWLLILKVISYVTKINTGGRIEVIVVIVCYSQIIRFTTDIRERLVGVAMHGTTFNFKLWVAVL